MKKIKPTHILAAMLALGLLSYFSFSLFTASLDDSSQDRKAAFEEEANGFPFEEDIDEEFLLFEESVFNFINSELDSLMTKLEDENKGEDTAAVEEGLSRLSSEALAKINNYRQNNTGSKASHSRLSELELYLAMQIERDREKSEALIISLPNDYEKIASLLSYVNIFLPKHGRELTIPFLDKEALRLESLDAGFAENLKKQIFLTDPYQQIFPNILKEASGIADESLDLNKFEGKVVLIDFWATWCLPCIQQLPYLIEAYNSYHEAGFDIISISLDEDKQTFQQFIAENDLAWHHYYDGKAFSSKVIQDIGISRLPVLFLLSKNGRVVAFDRDIEFEKLLVHVQKALEAGS